MCRLLCITSRALCRDDFILRVRRIADAGVPVVLREKDISESEYYRLLCRIDCTDITAHTFIAAAREYGCKRIHLPLPLLERADISGFELVGASAHSIDEAARAKALGAGYITAGHIFPTDCKKGLPPRGIELLRDIKSKVDIPVYALGGITPQNAASTFAAGADGVAVMSGFMRCDDIGEYIKEF